MNGINITQEILNLYRINILTATDNNILLPVYQEDEAILIHLCHISGIKPAFLIHDFLRCLFIIIITGHYPGSLNRKLADLSLGNLIPLLVHNLNLPAKARLSDCTNLINIFYSKMNTSGSDGLA